VQEAYVVTGSLTDSRTITLDEPVPLVGGKVRVIVQAAGLPQKISHETAEQILDYWMRIDQVRGSGRLFVP
jgi:hypothetical protein